MLAITIFGGHDLNKQIIVQINCSVTDQLIPTFFDWTQKCNSNNKFLRPRRVERNELLTYFSIISIKIKEFDQDDQEKNFKNHISD